MSDDRAEAFLELLKANRKSKNSRTIHLKAIQQAFAATHGQVLEERRRDALLGVLEELQAKGELKLPSRTGRRWDKAAPPPLPIVVTLPKEGQTKSKPWRTFPWHPRLSWASTEAAMDERKFAFLKRVQAGLYKGEFHKVLPQKYRSLKLTGDEKRLKELESSVLFRPDRLTPELLGYIEVPSPIRFWRLRPGGALLVLENEELYGYITRTAATGGSTLPCFRWDAIVCGHGSNANTGLKWLLTLGEDVQSIEYIGDLDKRGLEILMYFRTAAENLGLPEVEPAPDLLAGIFREADAEGWTNGIQHEESAKVPSEEAARLVAVLPRPFRGRVQSMLETGGRLPEELLGGLIAELAGL